ncbi:MAG: D-inositol-3-phosphate glycosyltransferase [Alphaproteobacteria bacterium MarineAlpha11_Bin1]|nr:MAG: D-inositol-3-phosphate glycosyltransferase [Alphaproteobacteria bacterium MarineAlpha11_Bin1]|tara:strand:+ start:4113 stop:5366 length:1254 start_codon:yes stop_codon:yes gene_type:complete
MKILFLTENFPPETNAAATRVYERALYWIREGHSVTIITSAPNFPEGKLFVGYANRWRQCEDMGGIRVVRVKTYIAANKGVFWRTLDFISFMISAFIAGLFEKRPDVICSTSPQFFAAVSGWLLSVFRRRPFVFELGDLWPASIVAVGAMKRSLPLRLIEKLELYLYQNSAAVAALTYSFKRNLVSRGIKATKIQVVRNGVDVSRYSTRPRHAGLATEHDLTEKFVLGYVGTHGMAHALDRVIDAINLLKDDDEIRFLFAGAGAAREELVKQAEQLGLSNIVFLPMQPKDRMPDVWSLCDVALIHLKNDPTFAEVIPSKIFEAMAMGLPLLISAPEGEATEIVALENAGIITPPEDPEALADAVLALRNDDDKRRNFAKNALAAAPKYSREKQAAEMIQVFTAAIDSQSIAPPDESS